MNKYSRQYRCGVHIHRLEEIYSDKAARGLLTAMPNRNADSQWLGVSLGTFPTYEHLQELRVLFFFFFF